MISVVLIEPENSGNIGAIARAMDNFGFEKLIIVNPKCNPVDEEAKKRAKHSQKILANAIISDKRILKKFDCRIATTSQLGTDFNLTRTPITPEQLKEIISLKSRIALIFGREGEGLHNEEIEECDFVVAIPTSKEYPTMNLSHAVSVVLYELSKKSLNMKIGDHIKPISCAEKEQIIKMLEQALKKLSFTKESKRETQRKLWKRLVSKAFLTKREAYALMGFLRKIIEN